MTDYEEFSKFSKKELIDLIQKKDYTISLMINNNDKMLNRLREENNTLKKKLKTLSNISTDFNFKILAIKTIFDFFNELIKIQGMNSFVPKVHGSFVRHFLETPFFLGTDMIEHSSPQNRDIDIMLNIAQHSRSLLVIKEFINQFNKDNSTGLTIVESKDCTVNATDKDTPGKRGLDKIPHYKFKMNFRGYIFDLDIIGTPPLYSISYWNNFDFDINTIGISRNGFTYGDTDMISTIINLKHKIAKNKVNILQIHNDGLKYKDRYIPLFLQIVFYVAERLKILNTGYKVVSDTFIPYVRVKDNEDGKCPQILTKEFGWMFITDFADKIVKNIVVPLKISNKNIKIEGEYISEKNLYNVRKIVSKYSKPTNHGAPEYSY